MGSTHARPLRHGLTLVGVLLVMATGVPLLMPHAEAAGIGYVYTVLEGPPGSTNSEAIAITNSGVVLGSAAPGGAFFYSEGTYTPVRGPAFGTYFTGMNNNGDMVGYVPAVPVWSFLYSGGYYTNLVGPCGPFVPSAINDNGVIVGGGSIQSAGCVCTLFNGEAYAVIAPPGWQEARGKGINNGGAIVGEGKTTLPSATTKGFLYSGGTYSTLASPPGWASIGSLTGINDIGAIIGWGYHGLSQTSFVYRDGGYTTINPTRWTAVEVHGINNNGVVVGMGRDSSGVARGFIATPTTVGPTVTPLNQFRPDKPTVIPVGGTVPGGTVLVKAIVTDVEATGQARLQLELRPVAENGGGFDGTVTHESPLVPSGGVAQVFVDGLQDTDYHWRARAANPTGETSVWVSFGDNPETAADFTVLPVWDKIGVFRPAEGRFYLDTDGNGRIDCNTDRCFPFGQNGDVPLLGDWNGTGFPKAGVFRPSSGTFYLDDGNSVWDDCGVDHCIAMGRAGDIPVVGDWDGSGASKVGVFRPSDGTWYFDANGNGVWEGCGIDRCLQFGLGGDVPLVGDWTGSGTAKVGTFRPGDGMFYLDANGNGVWEGCGIDRCLPFGMAGDIPLLGDWDGSGEIKVGTFRSSDKTFYLDYNGDGTWENCSVDRCLRIGLAGDVPLVGDWNGTGTAKVGTFRASDGTFYLDVNGNGAWDTCYVDKCFKFQAADIPLVGKW
jgi:hypothetical protein